VKVALENANSAALFRRPTTAFSDAQDTQVVEAGLSAQK